MIGSLSQASAQSDSPIRLISESLLPTGDGLASHFDSDRGIASHAAVIFADDFESGDLVAKWDETSNLRNAISLVNESSSPTAQLPIVLGKRSLKVTVNLGKNTGGGFTRWFESEDRIFIRFYTKFDEDCDDVHHFWGRK
jgi:hypothetical protein